MNPAPQGKLMVLSLLPKLLWHWGASSKSGQAGYPLSVPYFDSVLHSVWTDAYPRFSVLRTNDDNLTQLFLVLLKLHLMCWLRWSCHASLTVPRSLSSLIETIYLVFWCSSDHINYSYRSQVSRKVSMVHMLAKTCPHHKTRTYSKTTLRIAIRCYLHCNFWVWRKIWMIRLEMVFKNLDWEYTSIETNFFNLDSGYMCMVIMVRSKLLCAKTYRYTCSNLNTCGVSVYLY